MQARAEMPLVSVIMPLYNAESFVSEAIESVQRQTVEGWELFVIDDRSTDGSADVVRKYCQTDPRIKLLQNEKNSGVAKTRNFGITRARGQYIALLDSDDYWKPLFLEKMLSRAEETQADIIYCSYEITDEDGKKQCNDFIVPSETDFRSSVVRSVITCSTALLTAKTAKENPFPTDVYHEDIALWFSLLKNGSIARGVPEILATYRQRKASRSAGKLTSALRRWPIYRKYLKMSFFQSANAMIRYAYYGMIKYKRIK